MKKYLIYLATISLTTLSYAKPDVWIISDGNDNALKRNNGKHITDPDDVSAMGAYLIMSNHFNTKGIVWASNPNGGEELRNAPDQGQWARDFFGKAYEADVESLNKHIGGYQPKIEFIESYLKNAGEKYDPKKTYTNLDKYTSVKKLYEAVKDTKDMLNILCWGTLTEPAIFVNYCLATNQADLLEKVRFISHWTSSYYRVGSMERPDHVHNAFNDADSARYIKEQALNGNIKFYECAAIGETGFVAGGNVGIDYYKRFHKTNLGLIYAKGKYVGPKQYVDGSDAASFWVLLGDWGVSLNDINSNGTNTPEIELRNNTEFFNNAKRMQNEMLRRVEKSAKK